jgi:hypothetical protein
MSGTTVVPVEPHQPDVPDILRKREVPPRADEPEVGEFRQGTVGSQWALGRYLIGRAITESMGWALLFVGIVLLVLAVLAQVGAHLTFLAVLLAVLAIAVLFLRWALLGIIRRLTGFERFGPLEGRMHALIDDTSSDVLRELRRIRLPGRLWTLPLLAFRFFGRERRADTVAKLRKFDTARALPRARLDELHLVVREAFGGRVPDDRGWQTGRHV